MNTSKNPASEELVAIVDEENRVVGCASRGVMRRYHLIHRATYILLFNSQGELFVHQRTESKDVYPGYYDIAAGGVVKAWEDYDLSARRELAEEVGISGVPLTPLFDFYLQDENNKVWGRAYSCVADGSITLQEEEVQWGRFMNMRDLQQLRAEKFFTPDGLYLLDRYLAEQAKSI
ncbi:MAG: NUDIX hydrolase YfcD [Proteobacteria bacterium]|nr:NUDIX hydrolase YfcD [Pseudomonadota bacterium]MBU0967050.1 NUDIX hydrolase YfcD [Pseudomonadota bacterium]